MTQVPAWFERKFAFDFPVEQYPNLCVRLDGTPVRLASMFRGVSQERLVHKPDGSWSAQEQAGHLLDSESLWLARVDDFFTADATLSPADLTNRKTHEANHNTRDLRELLRQFEEARRRLVERARKLQPTDFARTKLHPRLKQPMRLVDHLYFVAEHDDHHLAKIWELIRP